MNLSPQIAVLVRLLRRDLASIARRLEVIQGTLEKLEATPHPTEEKERYKEPTGEAVYRIGAFDDKTERDARTEYDRQYRTQNSIKWATWSAVGAAIIYASIAAYQACQMKKSTDAAIDAARAASRAAEIAHKQLEATDRPWVSVGISINSPLTHDKAGVHVTFSFTPQNVGRSPAQGIYMVASLIAGLNVTNVPEWRKQQKKICDWTTSKERAGVIPGYILFPETHLTQESYLQSSNAEIEAYWATLPPVALHAEVPMGIVGCIGYFGASTTPHHTGFMFGLVTKDRIPIDVSKTVPIPKESLIFVDLPNGSNFVD